MRLNSRLNLALLRIFFEGCSADCRSHNAIPDIRRDFSDRNRALLFL
jgi:hypothetical protein